MARACGPRPAGGWPVDLNRYRDWETSRDCMRRAGTRRCVSGPCLLDDLQAVAILITEREHGGHAFPAQYLSSVDTVSPHLGVEGIGVLGREPDARLDTCGNALVGDYQGDGGGRAGGRHLSPTGCPAPPGHQAAPHAP